MKEPTKLFLPAFAGLAMFSGGTPTGASVTVAGPNGTDLRAGVLGAPPAASPGGALFNGVGTGLLFEQDGATTVTLTGLDSNLPYDRALVGPPRPAANS